MKRLFALALALAVAPGCSGISNTGAGALGGGAIGAGLGTIVGGLSGHPGAGAAIGAASGALVGGAIGNAEDQRERREANAAAAWHNRNRVSLADVVQMSHQHVGDAIIIQQIDTTYSNFDLRPEEITYLKQQGVSDRVILAMQQRRSPGPGQVRAVPAYGPGYVVYEPAPPPVSVGVGFGYATGPRRRCW